MLRRLRLISGLVLFAFVSGHLLNHSLGLVSLEALEAGRGVFLGVWRSWPGTVLLYGAFLTHILLALWALATLPSLKVGWGEGLRLLLGFAVPAMLLIHVLGTRLAHELYGMNDNYAANLRLFFDLRPELGVKMVVLLLAVWIHVVLGLYYWLRLKPWFARWRQILFAGALLLPTLALAGYGVGGLTVLRRVAEPGWLEALAAEVHYPSGDQLAWLYQLESWGLTGLAFLLALAFAARPLRDLLRRRLGLVQVGYPDGRRVTVTRGTTILAASHKGGIAHASVCGGRGRCSTCRVRVGRGREALEAPKDDEQRVLARVAAPPQVRLACQTALVGDLEVVPLLPAEAGAALAGAALGGVEQGQEREMVILFADLRGFTTLSEDKLPYDVVFVLNRYFAAMGEAIEGAGGRVDKFIGDGVMALFGVETTVVEASLQALTAARQMSRALENLNRSLAHDLKAPLRMGIGIHCGPAIVGAMGYGGSISLTAVGDTVNTASRLEALTKEFAAQLVVSEPVVSHAALSALAWRREEITIRGRARPLAVHVVGDAGTLEI